MANIFRVIDDFLFDSFPGFQKVQNWTQKHFGVDCFQLARICNVVVLFSAIPMKVFATSIYLGMLLTLPFIPICYLFDTLILKVKAIQKARTANGMRIYTFHGRLLVLVMTLMYFDLFTVCVLSCCYFMCCTPMSHSDCTIKKWWNSLGGAKLQHA